MTFLTDLKQWLHNVNKIVKVTSRKEKLPPGKRRVFLLFITVNEHREKREFCKIIWKVFFWCHLLCLKILECKILPLQSPSGLGRRTEFSARIKSFILKILNRVNDTRKKRVKAIVIRKLGGETG